VIDPPWIAKERAVQSKFTVFQVRSHILNLVLLRTVFDAVAFLIDIYVSCIHIQTFVQYQYSETNVMHFLFSLVRIKVHYMF
jgi:hypothetical protein